MFGGAELFFGLVFGFFVEQKGSFSFLGGRNRP